MNILRVVRNCVLVVFATSSVARGEVDGVPVAKLKSLMHLCAEGKVTSCGALSAALPKTPFKEISPAFQANFAYCLASQGKDCDSLESSIKLFEAMRVHTPPRGSEYKELVDCFPAKNDFQVMKNLLPSCRASCIEGNAFSCLVAASMTKSNDARDTAKLLAIQDDWVDRAYQKSTAVVKRQNQWFDAEKLSGIMTKCANGSLVDCSFLENNSIVIMGAKAISAKFHLMTTACIYNPQSCQPMDQLTSRYTKCSFRNTEIKAKKHQGKDLQRIGKDCESECKQSQPFACLTGAAVALVQGHKTKGSELLITMKATLETLAGKDASKVVDTQKPSPLQSDLVSMGGSIYASQCQTCHGKTGKGEPAVVQSLKLKVDFTNKKWQKQVTNSYLVEAINGQIRDGEIASIHAQMPRMSAHKVKASVAYIRWLGENQPE